ncbi:MULTISPECIES: MATE family efflux transporter [Eikenella]|uniref:Multidrug-efflux transporter n=1 Tax=Eikenella longinqua TaxID=1795827 RepID=A0A1A9RUW5_9NEIS|nr:MULTISPECIES: MATE family efflux transporter [Eikenella]OAM26130.1 multidrug efflux MATE transporter NorM [Eikenella longinqua]
MLLDLNRYSPAVFRNEARRMGALAMPMLLAQIAQVGVGFVDTVMAGGAGKPDLAAVALGSSAFVTVFITFMGIMTALNPMISQAHGAGETEQVGELGRQGMWYGLMLGFVGMAVLWLMVQPINHYLDLSPEVKRQFSQYVGFVALSMPAAMVHRALHAFASSLGKPKPIMWMSWITLFMNIPLNHIFVYGDLGMPALGGAGCGLASALVFWFNAAALWVYIAKQKYFQRFGLLSRFSKPNAKILRQITKLGVPIGLSFFLEVSLFTVMMLLIARLPGNAEDHVAAQQVVNSITSLIYVIPQGIGAAVTVRVGFSIGADRYYQARYAAGVALSSGAALSIITAVLTVLFRYPIMRIYTDDAAVIELGATILLFAAAFQLADAIQCIASYALRGYKVTKLPMVIHAIAFWVVGLGLGCLLAFGTRLGIYGFWAALVLSLMCAAVALLWCLEGVSEEMLEHQDDD